MYLKVTATDEDQGSKFALYFNEDAFTDLSFTLTERHKLIGQLFKYFTTVDTSNPICVHIARIYRDKDSNILKIVYNDGLICGSKQLDIRELSKMPSVSISPTTEFSPTHKRQLAKTADHFSRLVRNEDQRHRQTSVYRETQAPSQAATEPSPASSMTVTTERNINLLNADVKRAVAYLEQAEKQLDRIHQKTTTALSGDHPSNNRYLAVTRALAEETALLRKSKEEIQKNRSELYQTTVEYSHNIASLENKKNEITKKLTVIKQTVIRAIYEIARQTAANILVQPNPKPEDVSSFNKKFLGIAEIRQSGSTYVLSSLKSAYSMNSAESIPALIATFNHILNRKKQSTLANIAAGAVDTASGAVDSLSKAVSKTISSVKSKVTKKSKGKKPSSASHAIEEKSPKKIEIDMASAFAGVKGLVTEQQQPIFMITQDSDRHSLNLTQEGTDYLSSLIDNKKAINQSHKKLLTAYQQDLSEKTTDASAKLEQLRQQIIKKEKKIRADIQLHLEIIEITGQLQSMLAHYREQRDRYVAVTSALNTKLSRLVPLDVTTLVSDLLTPAKAKLETTRKPNIEPTVAYQAFEIYLERLRFGNLSARYNQNEDTVATTDLAAQRDFIRADAAVIRGQLQSIESYLAEIEPVAEKVAVLDTAYLTNRAAMTAYYTLEEDIGRLENSFETFIELQASTPAALGNSLVAEMNKMSQQLTTARAESAKAKQELEHIFENALPATLEELNSEKLTTAGENLQQIKARLGQQSTILNTTRTALGTTYDKVTADNAAILALCQLYTDAIESNLAYWHQQIKLLGGEKSAQGIRVPTAIALMTKAIKKHEGHSQNPRVAFELLNELKKIAADRIATRGHTAGFFNRRREATKEFYDSLANLTLEAGTNFQEKLMLAKANIEEQFSNRHRKP